MQAQGVANVVEPDGVGELRVDQADEMTPRAEAAGLFVHAGFPRQFRDQVRWNQMADVPQDGERTAAWGGGFVHPRRVTGAGFHAKPIFQFREK